MGDANTQRAPETEPRDAALQHHPSLTRPRAQLRSNSPSHTAQKDTCLCVLRGHHTACTAPGQRERRPKATPSEKSAAKLQQTQRTVQLRRGALAPRAAGSVLAGFVSGGSSCYQHRSPGKDTSAVSQYFGSERQAAPGDIPPVGPRRRAASAGATGSLTCKSRGRRRPRTSRDLTPARTQDP